MAKKTMLLGHQDLLNLSSVQTKLKNIIKMDLILSLERLLSLPSPLKIIILSLSAVCLKYSLALFSLCLGI